MSTTRMLGMVVALIALLLAAVPVFAADKSVRSRPNSQGGQTYFFSGKQHPVQCRPNSQGGQTCHAIESETGGVRP